MNHTELFRTYLAPLRQQKSRGNLRHARRGSSPARLEHHREVYNYCYNRGCIVQFTKRPSSYASRVLILSKPPVILRGNKDVTLKQSSG